MVTLHRNLSYLTLADNSHTIFVPTISVHYYFQMIVITLMGNRVNLEFLLSVSKSIPLHLLRVYHAPSTCDSIKGPLTTSIVETDTVGSGRNRIIRDESHHRHNTLQDQRTLYVHIPHS